MLQTDLEMDAAEMALRYKELWQVESLFREVKSVLETRPIDHQREGTIRGHVFASFLALAMLKELQRRMKLRGFAYEGDRLRRDLEKLEETRTQAEDRKVILRTMPPGDAGKALQAVGVALGPALQFEELESGEA